MAMSLARLQVLARERIPVKRRELLRALADVYFDSSYRLSDRERELFDDIVEKVLDEVEPLARRELAERLAPRFDAPRRLVVRLAGDVISVAAPVLTLSPVLADDDLALLALGKSQDHLLAISQRERLSERITDILVDRGDTLVLDSIVGNLGARFSPPGAAVLIEKARPREALWRRLANRTDLAVHVVDQLTPALADAMAAETARRGLGLDPVQSQTLLREMRETLAARLRAAEARARPLDELMECVADGSLRMGEAVIELADADRASDLAVLVCGRAESQSQTFVRHLFAADETDLMKTCRAVGLDLETFSAILRLRRRRRPFGAGDVGRLLRAYRAIPVQAAAARAVPESITFKAGIASR
jgi:uncharacterized protein (DUF2336 family)